MTDAPKWNLKTVKIKDLKPHPKNPRLIKTDEAKHLQKSLEKFGLADKPIVNQDMTIIGGHQRIKVLKKLKYKEVECLFPDRMLDEKEVEEFNIRLNRNTGEWDWDILANSWDPLELVEWGFNPDEMFNEGEKVNEDEIEEDGDALDPGKDEDAITKPGDIYELNGHRLICGDSTMPETVNNLLVGDVPILMVTDPPYGVEYKPEWRNKVNKSHAKIKAEGKVLNDDKINWALAWHLFPGSIAYVWHAAWFGSEVQKSVEEAGFKIISQIIWNKQHFALSRGDYHWKHEPCWYAIKEGHSHNWQGSRKESTVWEISNLNAFGKSKADGEERTAHSTQKPIECMAKPIRNNSAQGEKVYDPFLGSGTTLIAAEQLGRLCYGVELSPAYCDIIVLRWIRLMIKNNRDFSIKRNGENFQFPEKGMP